MMADYYDSQRYNGWPGQGYAGGGMYPTSSSMSSSSDQQQQQLHHLQQPIDWQPSPTYQHLIPPPPLPVSAPPPPPFYDTTSQPPPPASSYPPLSLPLPIPNTQTLPLPRPQQQQQGQWGFPRGGAIHLAAGMPDEMLPKHFGTGSELVKVTGKSCASCRTRKVKCDRRYPECTRCLKRKEMCDYGDDVSLALRPIVAANSTKNDDSAESNPSSPHTFAQPHPPPQNRIASSAFSLPYPPRIQPDIQPSRSLKTISDFRHQLARKNVNSLGGAGDEIRGCGVVGNVRKEGDEDERLQGFQQLWDRFLNQSNLGESSSDWRLALPTMASSLTIHLLDASMASCCFHLPAFHIFNPHIARWKQNIDSLDLSSQVAVGILTSLGARASPHSALLGIAGPDIENGNASHELVLSAGVRRENAWRAIVKQATELCSKLEVMQVPSVVNAQTLVAFVQMLMLSEVKPKTARFFLRAAIGLFYDMQQGGLDSKEVEIIKQSVGLTLYESDARIAAWLSLPVLISEDDLIDYFDGTGVHLVDLEQEHLGERLNTLFDPSQGPMTIEKSEEALRITGQYVCAVQRSFSKISSSRRPGNRFLQQIQQLWEYIDGAHSACQSMTGHLRAFAMAQDDHHHPANYDLLIGLRMHERLLDVMNLSNEWLRSKRNDVLSVKDRTDLEALLGVSNRRVRRCLKVLAFYAKVFHDSHDKHVVYHLFTQLEAVEGWATMAVQREGEVDEFGPLAQQCVLTETELDYFAQALELACFYTPLSSKRLEEFTQARQVRGIRQSRFVPFIEYDISVDPPQTDSTRSTDSPASRSSPQPRFVDIPVDTTAILTGNSSSFPSTALQPTVCSPSDGSDQQHVLSNWLLSGYAETSNSNDASRSASNSPVTSNSATSGQIVGESSSSPSTSNSLPGTLAQPYESRRDSFVSPLATENYVEATSATDLAFPPASLGNLAHHQFPLNFDLSHVANYQQQSSMNGSMHEASTSTLVSAPSTMTDQVNSQGLPSLAVSSNGTPWTTYTDWNRIEQR